MDELEQNLDFLDAGVDLTALADVRPAAQTAVLERLGPAHFRSKGFSFMGFLQTVYDHVAQTAGPVPAAVAEDVALASEQTTPDDEVAAPAALPAGLMEGELPDLTDLPDVSAEFDALLASAVTPSDPAATDEPSVAPETEATQSAASDNGEPTDEAPGEMLPGRDSPE
jgi:hypothetical protein